MIKSPPTKISRKINNLVVNFKRAIKAGGGWKVTIGDT
jgi:hypothetical protein